MTIARKKLVKQLYQSGNLLTLKNRRYKQRVLSYLNNKLKEDLGEKGDLTTKTVVSKQLKATAVIIAKQSGIAAGIEEASEFYKLHNINSTAHIKDKYKISKGDKVFTLKGNMQNLLIVERTALNFLQMMCGIATNTKTYCDAIKPHNVAVAATRKDWSDELLEKKAVYLGGGYTHRLGLGGFIMIKDNHLTAVKLEKKSNPITTAIKRVYASHYSGALEIEVENKKEALEAASIFRQHKGFSKRITPIIMLDNMPPRDLKNIANQIKGVALVEASGGVSLKNIKAYAKTGVDVISSSKLNRGAYSLDLSQKIVP